ncbi:G1/S-specific cyclin-D2 [Aethina tumida]|uniref:G1/S-specific cyclin-D2 n=1 Tax=Aethina tumida TaxID=116153 RepID=UPI00096B3823|nr:G1/S-specific cyclin-D2 [Aethina tumida]
MDLSCREEPATATCDRTIFGDPRVVVQMLRDEVLYMPKCNYFTEVQTDIQPFMRKVVTTWMVEVCEEQSCEDQVLPLAINLMDRFLCECDIKRQQFQLLAATCLLIASKMRSTNFLPVDLLCAYTDYSVSYDHIVAWEQLVLSKLSWNIASITGFDYIDHIIERSSWGHESTLIRRHAHTLVHVCYTEPALVQAPPSLIAGACLSSAIRGLKLPSAEIAVADICRMINLLPSKVDFLVSFVDNAVAKAAPSSPQHPPPKGYESPQYGPDTPTEVEDIYF